MRFLSLAASKGKSLRGFANSLGSAAMLARQGCSALMLLELGLPSSENFGIV